MLQWFREVGEHGQRIDAVELIVRIGQGRFQAIPADAGELQVPLAPLDQIRLIIRPAYAFQSTPKAQDPPAATTEVEDAVQPMHFDPVTGQIVPNTRGGPLSAVKKCVEIRRSGDFQPKFQWRNRKTVGRKHAEVMTVSAPGFVIYDLEIFVYLKKGKKPEALKAGHTRIVSGAGLGLIIEQ